MIKSLFFFLFVFGIFFYGIGLFRSFSNKAKLGLMKLVLYSTLCTFLSVGLLTMIVILF